MTQSVNFELADENQKGNITSKTGRSLREFDPLSLFKTDFGTYNRDIAKYVDSLNAAVFLGEMVDKFTYYRSKGALISHEKYGDSWFYMTVESVHERTTLSRREQETAIEILIGHGLIEQKNFGLPLRRHFRIKTEKLLEIFGLQRKDYSSADNDDVENSSCRKVANSTAPCSRTASIYTKKPKEKPKEQQQAAAAFSNPSFHMLKKFGFDNASAKHLSSYSPEEIHKRICDFDRKNRKSKISNPCGWLRKALVEQWPISLNAEEEKEKEIEGYNSLITKIAPKLAEANRISIKDNFIKVWLDGSIQQISIKTHGFMNDFRRAMSQIKEKLGMGYEACYSR